MQYAPKDKQTDSLCSDPQSVCDAAYGLSVGRGSFNWVPGAWTTIQQTVALNTPGKQDGTFTLDVNGERVISRGDIFYRDVPPPPRDDGAQARVPTLPAKPVPETTKTPGGLLGSLLSGLLGRSPDGQSIPPLFHAPTDCDQCQGTDPEAAALIADDRAFQAQREWQVKAIASVLTKTATVTLTTFDTVVAAPRTMTLTEAGLPEAMTSTSTSTVVATIYPPLMPVTLQAAQMDGPVRFIGLFFRYVQKQSRH